MSDGKCVCACLVVDNKLISLCGLHAQCVRENCERERAEIDDRLMKSIRTVVGSPGLLLVASRDALLTKMGEILLTLDAAAR